MYTRNSRALTLVKVRHLPQIVTRAAIALTSSWRTEEAVTTATTLGFHGDGYVWKISQWDTDWGLVQIALCLVTKDEKDNYTFKTLGNVPQKNNMLKLCLWCRNTNWLNPGHDSCTSAFGVALGQHRRPVISLHWINDKENKSVWSFEQDVPSLGQETAWFMFVYLVLNLLL